MRIAAIVVIWTAMPLLAQAPMPVVQPLTEKLSLAQCQQRATELNHRRKISQFAVSLAEAQHRQALSGYWPQVNFKAGIQRSDQAIDLQIPGLSAGIPAQQIPIAGGTALATIPANTFGPGFPPATIQLPVSFPGQTVSTPAQTFGLRSLDLKLADRDLATGSLSATWLLFDGGLRRGLGEQTNAGVRVMTAESKRTDLEVADATNRFYWSAVLAHGLRDLGQETLARMESTLAMTKAHAATGAGTTSQADVLKTQVIVESLRGVLAELGKNEQLAQAALANSIGFAWNTNVVPTDDRLPGFAAPADAGLLAAEAYQFNPDWSELQAGLEAAQAALKVKRSDYYPKFAIKGDLHRFWNGGFNSGLSSAQNRAGWTVGAGVELPVFNGLLTQNQVSEALLRVRQLRETQLLLKDGLGLQIKATLIELAGAEQVVRASAAASQVAIEARELNMRAYDSDMADPDKVIQSQLLAALTTAQWRKAEYDRLALGSRLTLVIGRQVGNLLTGATP